MSALMLTRRAGESIAIGSNVVVEVIGFRSKGQVVLRVSAPKEVSIDRQEVRDRKLMERGFYPGEVPG